MLPVVKTFHVPFFFLFRNRLFINFNQRFLKECPRAGPAHFGPVRALSFTVRDGPRSKLYLGRIGLSDKSHKLVLAQINNAHGLAIGLPKQVIDNSTRSGMIDYIGGLGPGMFEVGLDPG